MNDFKTVPLHVRILEYLESLKLAWKKWFKTFVSFVRYIFYPDNYPEVVCDLVGSHRYLVTWGVHYTLNPSDSLEKMGQDCHLFWTSNYISVLDVPDTSRTISTIAVKKILAKFLSPMKPYFLKLFLTYLFLGNIW